MNKNVEYSDFYINFEIKLAVTIFLIHQEYEELI
jgi:hypothetical protein